MSEDTKYNGWTNYETWLFNLWYDGAFEDDAWRMLDEAEPNPRYEWETKQSRATYDMEEYLKSFADEQAEGVTEATGFFADLLGAALDRVNFREIAKMYIDNCYEDWLEQNHQDDEDESEECEDE